MWSASNLTSDAFLFVYDITNAQSLQNLDFFAELIEMERENRQEQGKCWPAIMVAGNKCDLQGQRQVGAAEGLEWAKSRGCGFMETSAREVVNIEETFACKPHPPPLEPAAETDIRNQQSSSAWSKPENNSQQVCDQTFLRSPTRHHPTKSTFNASRQPPKHTNLHLHQTSPANLRSCVSRSLSRQLRRCKRKRRRVVSSPA